MTGCRPAASGRSGLRLRLALLLLLPGLTAGSPRAEDGAAAADPIVIVLSWDGVRYDYPDLADFPGLARMEAEGVRAERLRAGWPSTTFPGHVSMATGTYADRHGIVDNRFYDRERGIHSYSADASWLQAEPLWISAERQGVPTAVYFWVGSETDWRGQRPRYRMAPFDGGRLESLKVEQILAWLGLAPERQPRLIMSYWAGTDSAGHTFGPDSGRLVAQLMSQDYELERLMRGIDELGLWPRTTLMVVSDHGMAGVGSGVDLTGALARAGIKARVFGGAVAHVFLAEGESREGVEETLRATALALCADAAVYRGEELPAHMRLKHPTRTGDWVVVGPPPCVFSQRPGFGGFATRAMSSMGWGFGGHGYDPALPAMGGVFLAMGRGVDPALELGEVRQVDLAATVSALLGIESPRQSEGRSMW